jgi:hypothetical protein
MTRKGKSTDEIILALREAGVRLGQGETALRHLRSAIAHRRRHVIRW